MNQSEGTATAANTEQTATEATAAPAKAVKQPKAKQELKAPVKTEQINPAPQFTKAVMSLTFNEVDDRGRVVYYSRGLLVRSATRQFVPKIGKTYVCDVEYSQKERVKLGFAVPADFDGLEEDEWLSAEQYALSLREELTFERGRGGDARAFASNGQVVFAKKRVPIIFSKKTMCVLVEKGRVAIATPIPDYVLAEMREEEEALKNPPIGTSPVEAGTALARFAFGEQLIDPRTLDFVRIESPKDGKLRWVSIKKLLIVKDDKGDMLRQFTDESTTKDLKKLNRLAQQWMHPDKRVGRRKDAGLPVTDELLLRFQRQYRGFQSAYQNAIVRLERLEAIAKAEKARRATMGGEILTAVEEASESLQQEISHLAAFDKIDEVVAQVVKTGTARANAIKLIAVALADHESIESFEAEVKDMGKKIYISQATKRYDEHLASLKATQNMSTNT